MEGEAVTAPTTLAILLGGSAWPKSPRGLSGILRRLTTNLRKNGILVTFGFTSDKKHRIVTVEMESVGEQPSEPSEPSEPHSEWEEVTDAGDLQPSGDRPQPSVDNREKHRESDATDAPDGEIPDCSSNEESIGDAWEGE